MSPISQADAAKIRALVRLLPDFLPLWITENGRDKLIFISPQLMARYEEALGPTDDFPESALERVVD